MASGGHHRVVVAAGALAWACSAPPPEPDPTQRAEEAAVVQAAAAPARIVEGDGLEVRLAWDNLSTLHQGFFADEAAVAALGRGLSSALTGPATLLVRYDDDARVGTLRLELDKAALRSPIRAGPEGVDLLALRPVAMPLARYRDAIADRYDVRVRNFVVELGLRGDLTTCTVRLAGPLPHDGSVLSPCVSVGALRACGEVSGSLVRFPEHTAEITACFAP